VIVVAGEALVDLTPRDLGGVTGYVPHAGGSPYNVAVGLGRLRVPVTFLGRISCDRFGRLLRSHLAGSGVSLEYVAPAEEPTTLAFVHVGAGEPEYSFYAERTADRMLLPEHLGALPDSAALHLGSISLVLEPCASTLEGLMRRESRRRLVTLDPNVRPGLIDDPAAYRRRVRRWTELVDVVKVSEADLAWLHPGTPPSDVAAAWIEAGVALVLVTSGTRGARAMTAGADVFEPSPRVAVADTVGAGDGFTAGALAHLHDHGRLSRDGVAALSEEKLRTLLTVGNQIASDTCTRPGADPPWRGARSGVAGRAPEVDRRHVDRMAEVCADRGLTDDRGRVTDRPQPSDRRGLL